MVEELTQEQPKKKGLTEEQKAKMIAGRKAYWEKRKQEKNKPIPLGLVTADIEEAPKKEVFFFGGPDRNPHVAGSNASEFPAWYYQEQITDLKEDVRRDQNFLDQGVVAPTEIIFIKNRLARNKKRLEEITAATPMPDGKVKDRLAKAREVLGAEIRSAMFTREEMEKGLADPADECVRMLDPVMNVPGEFHDMFEKAGVRIEAGKCSRTGFEKVWKLSSRLLGLPSNTEYLRKD